MDVAGKKILLVGDSLSVGAASPGGVLATALTEAGARVRVLAEEGLSAPSLVKTGISTLAAELSRGPTLVIFFLGTNDVGIAQSTDEAAFTSLAQLVEGAGAVAVAVGPPSFPLSAKNSSGKSMADGSILVYESLKKVFGVKLLSSREMTADILTTEQGRASDGIHFSTEGASLFGQRLAAALLRAETKRNLFGPLLLVGVLLGVGVLLWQDDGGE